MKASEVKKKHPGFWGAVEQGVLNDLDVMNYGVKEEAKKVIAHNAAFTATYELIRYLKNAEKANKMIKLLKKA